MSNPPTTSASTPPAPPKPSAPASGAAADGVLLLNLGGPETLADVRPFLYRLFSDPEIIRIKNAAARRALAWAVSRLRAKKSRGLYRQIGGGSPLRRITEAQGEALAAKLAELGTPARVYVGMLCWKPFIDEALFERILSDGVARLCVLPLFPQYSDTTTGACFRRVREQAAKLEAKRGPSGKIAISYVREWYENPLYVEAMADLVEAGLEKLPGAGRDAHIFYSAHSLPEKYVAAGDPYLGQIKDCVARIDGELGGRMSARGVPAPGSSLGFQSKVGPVRWLSPSSEDVLRDLARRGVKRVLAVPVSFVSDHIETLQEMDVAYKGLAEGLGIAEFRRTDAPNLHPRFIAALADVAQKHLRDGGQEATAPSRPTISAVIVARDEARIIGRTLKALEGLADEVVVVDSGSTDGTAAIAESAGAVVRHQDWLGYSGQKNHAIGLAKGDWILSLDADEVVTPALAAEIKSAVAGQGRGRAVNGYRIPRVLYIGGRPFRHGGFYPDAQLRLFRRGAGRFKPRPVHEAVAVQGKVATLENDMLHYAYADMGDFERTMDKYARLSAQHYAAAGKSAWRSSRAGGWVTPAWTFLYRFVCRGGFLDGRAGARLNLAYSGYVRKKTIYLRQLRRQR